MSDISQYILETNDLSIGYIGKTNTVIKGNISIQLKSDSLTALVGSNGIGKSTLIRSLCGLQAPLSGNVIIQNNQINKYPPNQIAQLISVVLTDTIPESNLTVFELVALGRQPYTNWIDNLTSKDNQKINEAIELTDITHLKNKKHTQLSDGQLQKVLIARALAQDTPIILLDEPTTHLDFSNKVSILKLLQKLCNQKNKCILYATHDIDLAIQLADQVLVVTKERIKQGQPDDLISEGIFNELFENPDITFNTEKKIFEIQP